MINGIPVIGSNRGGIPETVGNGGIVLPLPERLTPATKIVPEAEEVEPWVDAVIRLWDDREFYEGRSALALREAERWHPDRLRPLYAEFFRNVRHQPGAPVIATAKEPGQGGKTASGVNGTRRAQPLALPRLFQCRSSSASPTTRSSGSTCWPLHASRRRARRTR